MPTKRSGLVLEAASAVIEIDDVLLAKIACGLAIASMLLRILRFKPSCSVAASMMTSAWAKASSSVAVRTRARI